MTGVIVTVIDEFDEQGQRPTPVARLRTTLLVVLRLRSRVAQRLSAKACDPDLANEVLRGRSFKGECRSCRRGRCSSRGRS